MKVQIKKLDPDAIIPQYQTKGSAGFDVHSLEDFRLYPSGRHVFKTGLSFVVPEGFELQIRPRSGLAAKYGITIINSPGTLDSSYRGELMIILGNSNYLEGFQVNKGDRIAQCVVNKIEVVDLVEVEEFSDEDMAKDRGGGLGSTGVGTEKMIKYGEQDK